MKSTPKHIVILDDHPLVAEGLTSICKDTGWESEIYAFHNVRSLDAFKFLNAPNLFLIDLQIQHDDGREVVKTQKKKFPEAKIIVISSFEDPVIIRSSYAIGADAYIIKNATFDEMKKGIMAIWEGKRFIQKQVEDALYKEGSFEGQRMIKVPRLTDREKLVLKLIIKEKTNKEIAAALFLSEKTIEAHRANLVLKCDVRNTAGLVRKAIEWGLV